MTTPEETRERVVRLETQSIAAALDRQEMKAGIKEMGKDIVKLAVGQEGLSIKFDNMETKQDAYATKLDDHFADLRKANGKSRHIDAAIIGTVVTFILAVVGGVAKWMGWF